MNSKASFYPFDRIPYGYESDYYDPHTKTLRFSKTELNQILIAIGVLTIAFSFAFSPYPPLANIGNVISNIPLAFIAIVTAFFCHELAHKYMGQKYGYWSEFRMYNQGLILALFLGIFTGFIFAAPGAVQIAGSPRRDEMGKIALAGPVTNIILSGIFIILSLLSSGFIAYIATFVAYINAFLALFNLLPFGFFDGKKIFNWRKDIWGSLIIIGIIFLAVINI